MPGSLTQTEILFNMKTKLHNLVAQDKVRGFSFFDRFDFDQKKTITRSLSHIDLSLELWGISLRTTSIAFAITLAI